MASVDFITPQPLADAIRYLSDKTPIGSVLKSADWARVPLALREAAQFAATVESARLIQRIQDRTSQAVKLERSKLADGREGAYFDRAKFIAEIRKIAIEEGLTPTDPEDRGTIRDITSEGRLGLIFDTQTKRAQGFARWKMEMDPDALDSFPAYELTRVESREVPRGFRKKKSGLVADPKTAWTTRWLEAGGTLIDGRMVALKTDSIWSAISRFGTPWAPFDFNSGMGVKDVGRTEAERLDLIKPGDRLTPVVADFTDNMRATSTGLSDRLRGALKTIFGEQVDISGDTLRWVKGVLS